MKIIIGKKTLINLFTDEGDVVIDPVAGSGSTIIAAEMINRKAYGFEIKKDFCMKANKWLEEERTKRNELKEYGFHKSELEKTSLTLWS